MLMELLIEELMWELPLGNLMPRVKLWWVELAKPKGWARADLNLEPKRLQLWQQLQPPLSLWRAIGFSSFLLTASRLVAICIKLC